MVDKMVAQPTITFLLLVAEVNRVQARARGRKEVAKPTLTVQKNLVMWMLRNKKGLNGLAAASPPSCLWKCSSTNHILRKRVVREGKCNYSMPSFNIVYLDYVPYPCYNCKKSIRMYCLCDPGAPLCSVCFGLHFQEHGN